MRNVKKAFTVLLGKDSEEAKVIVTAMTVLGIAQYERSADIFTLSVISGALTVYVVLRLLKIFNCHGV